MTDQVPTDGDLKEQARQRTFDRRYRLLELGERRADRAAKLQEIETNRILKEKELDANEGRGLKFTSAQATVAAAAIALVSGLLGGAIQGLVTRDVEADKNRALIAVEDLKAKANISLERQKQEAAEQLDRAKFETTLILKATEAPRREDQIKNLKFFLNTGFIHDPEGKIAKIDESAYPSTPILENLTPADVFRETRPSIGRIEVQINNNDGQMIVVNRGTCFIVSKDGYALTSAHLIRNRSETSISVKLGSIAATPQPAKVVQLSDDDDIALIKMVANIDYKPLSTSKQHPILGDSIIIVGYPGEVDVAVLLGNMLMSDDPRGYMQITAPVAPGQSGSPVLNKNGEVVGIVSGSSPLDRLGVVEVMPINRATAMLAAIGVSPK